VKLPTRSLTLRMTVLLGMIACVVLGVLGTAFYMSAERGLISRADYALCARVSHFRNLMRDFATVNELRQRPVLFEQMLGSEQDVLIFRRRGAAPFVNVNPHALEVPLLPVPADHQSPTLAAIRTTRRPDGASVHWVSVIADVGADHEPIEIIAAHPLAEERRMLRAYGTLVALAVMLGALTTTVLTYFALRRGLRPLRVIAEQAAEVSPQRLSVRLDVARAPDEVRSLILAFNAMLDRLTEGYERLQQFSADLAHEIRTPVGALIGQTEVSLARARSAAEYQNVLESNLEELQRLRNIAENILFLAQADYDTLTVERQPMDLNETLVRIANYFEGPADERGLRFEIAARGSALANPLLCQRAIGNLVVNAVRYATPGSVIRLSGELADGSALIAVENEADAVPHEQMHRLFDRFWRGDAARASGAESNGLGLAIVRAIMHLHGGTASVSCSSEKTIRFELAFPAA
jgi:two-component system heavy metal sensor histidine kinase CusS